MFFNFYFNKYIKIIFFLFFKFNFNIVHQNNLKNTKKTLKKIKLYAFEKHYHTAKTNNILI